MHEARCHTLEALRVLQRLMRSAQSESVRLNAAKSILNRGWGRPIQAFQVDGRFLTKKLTDLTTDEIRELEQRSRNDRTRSGSACAHRRHGKRETREHKIMSKLREIIRDESRRRRGPAGPLVVMNTFWEPVLSPTRDRIVGKRQTGARAKIVGDPHRRVWEQHDKSLEAFKMRVKAAAEAAHF